MTDSPDVSRPSATSHAPFEGEPDGDASSTEAKLARFEALVAALPDLVLRIDRDLVVLDCIEPEGFSAYLPPEELIGRPLGETVPPIAAASRDAIARALAEGGVHVVEVALDYPDGLRHYEGRVVRAGEDEVLAVVREVSERVRADGARRHFAERLSVLDRISRAALSSLELPVLCSTLGEVLREVLPILGASITVFGEPGRMRMAAVHVTDAGERLRSRPNIAVPPYIQAALAEDASPRVYPIPPDATDEASERLREEGVTHAITVPLRVEHTTIAALNLGFGSDPELDEDQRALIRAIGDRIASAVSNALLHQRMRRHELELRQAQRLEALGRLAGGIAHDFNNLLTVVEMHLGLARRRLGRDESADEDLREIEETVHRAADMTRQLLAFGRRGPLALEILEIDEVARALVPILMRLVGESVRFETRYAAPGAQVEADRTSLEQVFMNLALNARDAMPQGGTVRIETEVLERGEEVGIAEGPCVHLVVADTGAGMDEATAERIFDPFFTTKTDQGGSGLGLATVHGVVSQFRGRVTVRSAPGRGTTFDIYLPQASAEKRSVLPKRPSSPGSGLRGTLLLVEDEAAVRRVTARLLREHGFEVHEAEDGEAALAAIEREGDAISIVVSDVVMPRMGGVELVRALTERHPDLPILLVSGYDEGQLAGLPDDAAVVGTLLKPVPPHHLLSVLDAALRARAASV